MERGEGVTGPAGTRAPGSRPRVLHAAHRTCSTLGPRPRRTWLPHSSCRSGQDGKHHAREGTTRRRDRAHPQLFSDTGGQGRGSGRAAPSPCTGSRRQALLPTRQTRPHEPQLGVHPRSTSPEARLDRREKARGPLATCHSPRGQAVTTLCPQSEEAGWGALPRKGGRRPPPVPTPVPVIRGDTGTLADKPTRSLGQDWADQPPGGRQAVMGT